MHHLLGNLLQAEEDYLASVELGHVPAAAKLRALRSVSPGPHSLRCSPRNLCADHQMPGRADGEVAAAPELPMGSTRTAARAPGPPPRASLVALPSAPVGPPAE